VLTPQDRNQPPAPEPAAIAGSGGLGLAVAALTAVRVGSVAAGFLTSVLGARLIGPAGLGVAGAAITIATIGALVANGGINIATIYLLGRRPEERAVIVGRVAVLAIVAVVLAAFGVLAAGAALRESVLGGAPLDLLLATAGLGAGTLLFELGGGTLLGLHRRSAYIVIQVVEAVAALVLTAVILLAVSRTATGFLAAAALGYWLGAAVALAHVVRGLGPIRLSYAPAFTRELLAIGARGQVGNVLQFLNLRLDLLLVPALLNLSAAGVYLVAVRVSEVITQVSSSAAAFLFPHVAAQEERRNATATERAARMTLLVVLVGGLPLFILAELLLGLAFGPEFAGGATTLRIMLVAMLPLSIVRLMAGDLKGRGRPGLVSIAALVAVLATIAFDLLLIPLLGIEGAALASLLTYTTSAIVLLAVYRRETDGSLVALVPGWPDVRELARLGIRAMRARGGRGATS